MISPHTVVPAPVTDQHFTDLPTMATVPTCVNLRWRHGRESRMAFTPPAGAINGCGAAGWPGCLRTTRRWTHPIWRTRNFFADFSTLPTTTDPRGLAWRRERRLRRIKTTHLPPPPYTSPVSVSPPQSQMCFAYMRATISRTTPLSSTSPPPAWTSSRHPLN